MPVPKDQVAAFVMSGGKAIRIGRGLGKIEQRGSLNDGEFAIQKVVEKHDGAGRLTEVADVEGKSRFDELGIHRNGEQCEKGCIRLDLRRWTLEKRRAVIEGGSH